MIEVHLIGYTADLEHLVLDLDAGADGRYRLVVDPDLFATLDQLREERRAGELPVGDPEEFLDDEQLAMLRAARRAADAPPSVAADPEAADPEVAPTLDPEPSAPRQLGERLFEADPAARARVHAAAEEPERATGADDEAGDDGTWDDESWDEGSWDEASSDDAETSSAREAVTAVDQVISAQVRLVPAPEPVRAPETETKPEPEARPEPTRSAPAPRAVNPPGQARMPSGPEPEPTPAPTRRPSTGPDAQPQLSPAQIQTMLRAGRSPGRSPERPGPT